MSSVRFWGSFRSQWSPWEAQNFTRVNEWETENAHLVEEMRRQRERSQAWGNIARLGLCGAAAVGLCPRGAHGGVGIWGRARGRVISPRIAGVGWRQWRLGRGVRLWVTRTHLTSPFSQVMDPMGINSCKVRFYTHHLSSFVLGGHHINYCEPTSFFF